MENVEKEMTADTPDLTSDKDPKTVVKATVLLIQKGIKDQVFSVSTANLQLNECFPIRFSSFHLNGHTLGFYAQTQKFESPCTA